MKLKQKKNKNYLSQKFNYNIYMVEKQSQVFILQGKQYWVKVE